MILLDTQALIWFAEGDDRLGAKARDRIVDATAARDVAVSPISFWEVAMLVRKSRIHLGRSADEWTAQICGNDGPVVTALTPGIATAAGQLPDSIHGDPADRIIIATARSLACPLLTADRKILAYAAAGHVSVIDARL